MDGPGREHDRLECLVAIMDRLREPGGCPWDREQTNRSLRRYLLEECYEVADAIDQDDDDALREELGDLLLQIVFLARIAKERRRFAIADVIRGINEKMIRRHPHVFGDESAETSAEVLRNWERIKRDEKAETAGRNPSLLEGIPVSLPALLKAHSLGVKAARVGFDWSDARGVLSKVDEELDELRDAISTGDREDMREELGDVLFSLTMLGRKLELDPEEALEGANRKFRERFRRIESSLDAAGLRIEDAGLERLESLWEEAKRR